MVNDVEHLFLCFVGCVTIFCGKMSMQILSHFSLSCLSLHYWIVSVLNIFLIHVLIKHDLQVFSPILRVVFSLSSWRLLKHKNFNVNDVQFIYYLYCYLCWCHHLLTEILNINISQHPHWQLNHLKTKQNLQFSYNLYISRKKGIERLWYSWGGYPQLPHHSYT